MDPIEALINQALSKVVTFSQCKLCDVKMETAAVQNSHLPSKRHQQNLSLFKQQVRQSVSSNLANAQKPENPKIPSKIKQFDCKTCSRKFGAQSDLDNHNGTESHQRNTELYCFTCSLLMQSKKQLWEHLKTEKHQKQLKTLRQPPIDGKYSPFCKTLPIDLGNQMLPDYCSICNMKFPTIRLSVGHYTSLSHGKAAELWLKSKQEVVDKSKKKQALPPRFSKLRQERIFSSENPKEDLEPGVSNANYCEIKTQFSINATNQGNSDGITENLKSQVFNELEKLVQKLYYSKEVPYNVGLNYLKKINKEVDEIIIKKNYEVKENQEEKRACSLGLNEAAFSNNFVQNGFNFTPLLYPVNFEPQKENNAAKIKPEKNKNISDLLKDIILKRQNCKENLDELELLSEIEVLLKQLENVEGEPLLDDILKCLQGFNQEIDFNNQQINIEDGENTATKSKFVYSKNHLLSLNPCQRENENDEVNVYNYYSGSDFKKFMNFTEVYLQGSLNA